MPPIPSKHRCPICKRACLKRAIVKNTNGSVIQIHIMGERGLCCGEKNVKYVKKRATVALAKPTNTPEFAEL
ncbi:23006_t:CDS:2 [Rhizophagus irregularis]|nr:23006_t:CDS:2 [Rhizophagus irregularis]